LEARAGIEPTYGDLQFLEARSANRLSAKGFCVSIAEAVVIPVTLIDIRGH